VSTQLAMFAAMLLIVRTIAVQLIGAASPEGASLVGRCFVDLGVLNRYEGHGFKVAGWQNRARHIPALPISGANRAVLSSSIPFMDQLKLRALQALPTPAVLRQFLLDSARPVKSATQWEAGQGFVSLETTVKFLSSLTLGSLLDHLCHHR